MSDHFVTEFGHRIDFVAGYLDRNRFYVDDAKKRADYWAGRVDTYAKAGMANPTVDSVARDLVQFSATIAFLRRFGLLGRWQKAVDLGGQEGCIARFFRAAGLIDHATNVDLDDFSKVATDQFFENAMISLRLMHKIERQGVDRVRTSINRLKILFDHYPDSPTMDGVITNLPHPLKLDQNYVMNLFDTPGSYDLVMSYSVLEFVDLDEALAKIRSLLNPGGLYVGATQSPWYPVYPNGLVGNFPYFSQRLTLSDMRRYAEQSQPELLENLERRYNTFHRGRYRPTPNDWLELARKHGLRTVAIEQIKPKRYHWSPDDPQAMLKSDWFNPLEVLRDIHEIRPDVSWEDLATQAVRVAFRPI